jgi:hypothetical protein
MYQLQPFKKRIVLKDYSGRIQTTYSLDYFYSLKVFFSLRETPPTPSVQTLFMCTYPCLVETFRGCRDTQGERAIAFSLCRDLRNKCPVTFAGQLGVDQSTISDYLKALKLISGSLIEKKEARKGSSLK